MNPKDCIQKNFDAFAGRDEQGLLDTYTEDCELIDITELEPFYGHDFLRAHLKAIYEVFPDIHVENAVLIAEGNIVAGQFDIVGTHAGEFMGCPASNNLIRWRTCSVFEMTESNDRIKRETYYYDKESVIKQLQA